MKYLPTHRLVSVNSSKNWTLTPRTERFILVVVSNLKDNISPLSSCPINLSTTSDVRATSFGMLLRLRWRLKASRPGSITSRNPYHCRELNGQLWRVTSLIRPPTNLFRLIRTTAVASSYSFAVFALFLLMMLSISSSVNRFPSSSALYWSGCWSRTCRTQLDGCSVFGRYNRIP